MITQEYLKELFSYDEKTGLFERRITVGGRLKGEMAGCFDSYGYIVIKINRMRYKAHRLAWLYIYGHIPNLEIDHMDGIKSNNSINNLRQAERWQNAQNLKIAHSNSLSGILGVCQSGKKWKAQIQFKGKRIYIGTFNTSSEAHDAYIKKKK